MSRALIWATLLCTGLAAANPVSASGWQGSYSNICVHPQTGDLLGAELSFITYGGGTAVLWQPFEGEGLPPQVLVLREERGTTVAAEDASAPALFSITRERTRMRVRYLHGQAGETIVLRPGASQWMGARPPVCRA
ncbi:hypothetical protein [Stenotrophomonas sp.]|uniref:hypothetical protein n=1 Tax=Stenotrophomonas sp. TaxID=69392 RepID=UPI0028A22BB4|nr:hypothetical protein [Stenotrophomonas sp.]